MLSNQGWAISTLQTILDCRSGLLSPNGTDIFADRFAFLSHIYLPLLKEMPDKAQIFPPGLTGSEARFVCDLRDYWRAEKDKSLAGKEIFLLRNLSRGHGIGFFEERRFYPDFILWIVKGDYQHIIFIEPHGMLHAPSYIHDEKAGLQKRLPELAKEIGKRSGKIDVCLDAFIISATPYDELHRHYDDGTWDRSKLGEKHILFQERNSSYDYIKIILDSGLSLKTNNHPCL